jgi:FkbM family methyltransferase
MVKKILKNNIHFFVNDLNDKFWESFGKNGWENYTYIVFDLFLEKNRSYIDIGAWIGPTVLYGCQRAKCCYAIEPDPVAFKALQDNINLNRSLQNKITLFNGCLGEICGEVRLGISSGLSDCGFGESVSSMIFSESEKYLTVNSLTIEKLIEKYNIEDCNFIKMDIEGGEIILLPSMKDYLQKNKPTLNISLHPNWFRDIEKDSGMIIDVLTMYRYLFFDNGKRIQRDDLHRLLLQKKNITLVATEVRRWFPFFCLGKRVLMEIKQRGVGSLLRRILDRVTNPHS